MSRDVITVGSTMRIPLLYRGEYSQWRERFMNYLEEQTDGEAMINSISEWLPNDIESLNDSNDLLKIYGMLMKGRCMVLKWKQYGTLMRQTKNLMDINIDALYNILKQNQGDVNDAMGYKKKAIVVTSDPLALVAEKTKVNKRKEKVVVQSSQEVMISISKQETRVREDQRKRKRKNIDRMKQGSMTKSSAIIARRKDIYCQDLQESQGPTTTTTAIQRCYKLRKIE
ncbi:hypothetical protein Tco_1258172 [Tanacetum coccineum]